MAANSAATRSLRSRLAWASVALYVVLVVIGLRLQAVISALGLSDAWAFFALLWAAVIGALILQKFPSHPVGWLFIVVPMSFAVGLVAQVYAIHAIVFDPGSLPAGEVAAWIAFWITYPGTAGLAIFLPLLFPDGHLPSARWRPVAWTGVGLLSLAVALAMITPDAFTEYPNIRNPFGIDAWRDPFSVWSVLSEVLLAAMIVVCCAALFARMRSAGPVERLQIRWFAFAVALLVVAFAVEEVTRVLPGLRPVSHLLTLLAVTGLPTAAGIAILRYRLYEIDVIINRTVVYVSLTAVLAGLYTASVALFQRLIVALTGENSDLAVVMTLFVLATVFTPIKNTLQTNADRYIKSTTPPRETSTAIDDLVRLAELHSRGILTDAEFAAKKKQVLGI